MSKGLTEPAVRALDSRLDQARPVAVAARGKVESTVAGVRRDRRAIHRGSLADAGPQVPSHRLTYEGAKLVVVHDL